MKLTDHEPVQLDGPERRRHARYTVVRPCKVRDCRTLVYSPGQTCDVSAGGALLRIERVRPVMPGDELEVAVAWTPGAVLGSETMVKARVKRVMPIDHYHQAVALEFQSKPAVSQRLAA